MGHVTKRNSRWQATYRDPDYNERTKTFDRKADAEKWLATVQTDMLRGAWVDPAAGRETFGSYCERWAGAQMWRPTTARRRISTLELHVLPFLGERPLGAIRLSDLQAWAKGRCQVLGPTTLASTVQVVRSVLGAAVADRLIAVNPATDLKVAKAPKREVVPLEDAQVFGLVEAVRPRYRAAVVVAAGAGLRQGEVFGLCADRVDFLRRQIRVDQQLVMGAGGPPYLGPPKTAASVRTIPVPDVVLGELTEHMRRFPSPSGLLFAGAAGETMTGPTASRVFRAAADLAGVPRWATWHDLRHYYASVLISAGESVKVVQTRLGHASAAMTIDVYSHLWPADDDRTRGAVEARLGGLRERSADLPRTGELPPSS